MSSLPDLLYDRFKQYAAREGLIIPGEKIVVAVSGGIDSVALFEMLCRLRTEQALHIVAAHIHHGLRGLDADKDSAFVEKLGENINIPVYTYKPENLKERAQREHRSIQDMARDVRYTYLQALCDRIDYNLIATGHNADDNAETVFFNLLRGSGLEGLAGIPPRRENIIRPLLFADRKEILAYCQSRGIKYREDRSNSSSEYTRNVIRNEVFPLLREKVRTNVTATLNRTAELSSMAHVYFEDRADNFIRENCSREYDIEMVLPAAPFQRTARISRYYIVRKILSGMTVPPVPLDKIKAIVSLMDAQSGAKIPVANGFIAVKETDCIRFTRETGSAYVRLEAEPGREISTPYFRFKFCNVPRDTIYFSLNGNIEFIDAGKVNGPVTVRSWSPGDVFIPLGMRGEKKLSDFFIDEKVPTTRRQRIPVVETDGMIIWICGYRLDDRFKITGDTKEVYKLEFSYRP
jgi:tRNA(Ile)-lysidine synthase